jgi:acyl-CoA thioester hydrolase
MRTLDESVVGADEIDGLGHMNVRFYMERARWANRALVAEIGLGETPDARLVEVDSYTRYLREQFEGSRLTVDGGVLETSQREARAYFEIRNPARGEIAATFIIATALSSRIDGESLPLPAGVAERAEASRVELPEHGRPRTIDLAPPRLDLEFETIARRFAEDPSDPMSRRFEWTVEPDMCDEHGLLSDIGALMFGGWRPPKPEEMRRHGPMTFDGDGRRLGWASLETRTLRVSPARAGDRLSSIGAEIGLHRKVRHSRRWLFDVTTGRLVSLNDDVSVALDLDARRSIEIPASIRSSLEARHAAEFA